MQRIVMAVVAAAVVGCGGSTAPDRGPTTPTNQNPGGQQQSGPMVMVMNNNFSPDRLTTTVNTLVTWKWDSCGGDGYGGMACTDHAVSFSDGTASSVQSTGTFSRRFTTAGTYTYKCSIHEGYMTGTVVVQ